MNIELIAHLRETIDIISRNPRSVQALGAPDVILRLLGDALISQVSEDANKPRLIDLVQEEKALYEGGVLKFYDSEVSFFKKLVSKSPDYQNYNPLVMAMRVDFLNRIKQNIDGMGLIMATDKEVYQSVKNQFFKSPDLQIILTGVLNEFRRQTPNSFTESNAGATFIGFGGNTAGLGGFKDFLPLINNVVDFVTEVVKGKNNKTGKETPKKEAPDYKTEEERAREQFELAKQAAEKQLELDREKKKAENMKLLVIGIGAAAVVTTAGIIAYKTSR